MIDSLVGQGKDEAGLVGRFVAADGTLWVPSQVDAKFRPDNKDDVRNLVDVLVEGSGVEGVAGIDEDSFADPFMPQFFDLSLHKLFIIIMFIKQLAIKYMWRWTTTTIIVVLFLYYFHLLFHLSEILSNNALSFWYFCELAVKTLNLLI